MVKLLAAMIAAVLAGGARVAAAPGKGHVTLTGDVNASFDIGVERCITMKPGDSIMNGFTFQIPHGDVIALGLFQVAGYSGDKTYERTPANGTAMLLSLMGVRIQKTPKQSQSYDVDAREKKPGNIKATVTEHGRTGSATFEGINLEHFGKKEGIVSGSITWECSDVQNLR
jgi:hypothetical protein